MSERIKRVIGIILLILSIISIYIWEGWGRDNFTTTEIVVLKDDIPAHTIISENMLRIQHIDIDNLIHKPILDKNQIIGKMSKSYIAGNSPLSQYYFEQSDLIPKDGEYIFQMPKTWIKSCPSTLRRSDDAYLYPVLEKEIDDKYINNGTVYDDALVSGNAELGLLNEELDENVHKNLEEKLEENLEENLKFEVSNNFKDENLEFDVDIKPIRCLKIAFVKNQSNQEVQSVEKESRINGTSSVSTVEFIARFDDICLLERYRRLGYQFMILYR